MPKRTRTRHPRSLSGAIAAGLVLAVVVLVVRFADRPAAVLPVPMGLSAGAITPVIDLDVPPGSREAAWTAALAGRLDGRAEARVEFGRIDVLTDVYAVEIDFLKKWKEGVGQALHYGEQTGKIPCLALIADELDDDALAELAYVDRLCLEKGIKLVLLRRAGAR